MHTAIPGTLDSSLHMHIIREYSIRFKYDITCLVPLIIILKCLRLTYREYCKPFEPSRDSPMRHSRDRTLDLERPSNAQDMRPESAHAYALACPSLHLIHEINLHSSIMRIHIQFIASPVGSTTVQQRHVADKASVGMFFLAVHRDLPRNFVRNFDGAILGEDR
jgi:hypothetical protein